jgi:prolyl oligopeptidase
VFAAQRRAVEVLKRAPVLFDASGLTVDQHFATSADGTRVPYFVVRAPDAPPGPTLLNAYGGFEVSRTPYYDGVDRPRVAGPGRHLRGRRTSAAAASTGPDWHRAAMLANRPRAFEDLAAVRATWSTGASPNPPGSVSRAAATAACWSARC